MRELEGKYYQEIFCLQCGSHDLERVDTGKGLKGDDSWEIQCKKCGNIVITSDFNFFLIELQNKFKENKDN